MIFSYYPGCSLHGSSREYDVSTQAVFGYLGIELQELNDWICCGASSGHSIDENLNIALPAHNLHIAQQAGLDLAVPCAACYNRFKTAQFVIRENEDMRQRMQEVIGLDTKSEIRVLHLLEIFKENLGLDKIRTLVTNPMTGLKVACYYGCLLVRPQEVTKFDDPEHPFQMDEYIKALGAEAVPWSYKAECCGGSLALTRDDIVKSLVGSITGLAKEAGAEVIVTACPLCLENLDARQTEDPIPILYFTELSGLAFGLKESPEWLKKHMHDPTPVLKTLNLIP